MGKFKLNKKHLYLFVVSLLLFSLNLNTFASTSFSIHLADYSFEASYFNDTLDDGTDCTSSTEVSSHSITINDVSYPSTRIMFPLVSRYYARNIIFDGPIGLYTCTNYQYNFYVHLGNTSGRECVVTIYIFFYLGGEYYTNVVLCNLTCDSSAYVPVSGTFRTPDLSGNVSCAMLASFNDTDGGSKVADVFFDISDINFLIDDPLINGTPINTPSTEELENALNEYESVMNELPQVDEDELEDLMSFDFDSFSDGMSFVREMFERTMNTFGFNAVLVFALTVGLATYIIGRKVG